MKSRYLLLQNFVSGYYYTKIRVNAWSNREKCINNSGGQVWDYCSTLVPTCGRRTQRGKLYAREIAYLLGRFSSNLKIIIKIMVTASSDKYQANYS